MRTKFIEKQTSKRSQALIEEMDEKELSERGRKLLLKSMSYHSQDNSFRDGEFQARRSQLAGPNSGGSLLVPQNSQSSGSETMPASIKEEEAMNDLRG
jgi:hypothetical protein